MFLLGLRVVAILLSRIIDNFKDIERSQYSNYEYASTQRNFEEEQTTKYVRALVFAFVSSRANLLD